MYNTYLCGMFVFLVYNVYRVPHDIRKANKLLVGPIRIGYNKLIEILFIRIVIMTIFWINYPIFWFSLILKPLADKLIWWSVYGGSKTD